MAFDVLLQGQLEKLINKSNLRAKRKVSQELRLAAYLYVRATDSWNAVNDELGLRSNFDEEIGEFLFAVDLLRGKDEMMRKYAFTEQEAKEYVFKHTEIDEFRTMEQEIEEYRNYLNGMNLNEASQKDISRAKRRSPVIDTGISSDD